MNLTRVVVVGTSCSGKATGRLARILATNSWVKSECSLGHRDRIGPPIHHANSAISASAFSSQYVMPIAQ